jgi:hypothetical protein
LKQPQSLSTAVLHAQTPSTRNASWRKQFEPRTTRTDPRRKRKSPSQKRSQEEEEEEEEEEEQELRIGQGKRP